MGRLRMRPVEVTRRLLSVAMILSLFLAIAPPVVVRAATEAPILILVDTMTNPFGTYLQEILNAEGVKDYEVRPLAELDSGLLVGRRAVLLAESSPSATQIAALDTFVSTGGGLVAMRPVAGLDATLGITRQAGATAEGYLRITDSTLGTGLYSDTMQFHGTASHYTLAGAAQVAELYSNRTTTASYPAATLANRGSGKAAMFAYDLAGSIVLTRQGNPANADLDMDNDGIVRTNDLFMGWIDIERANVPQADIQQRLLVRLLEAVSTQPVPRLWYFPGMASSVLVATSDAHGQADPDFQVMIDAFQALDVKATFYLQALPWAQHPAAGTVESWRSLGFDFAPHPYSSGGYGYNFDDGYAAFNGWYPAIDARTERTHEVRWSGWTDAATEEASHGTVMDFNFYQFAPWLTAASHAGYMTGSGQPMRFIDESGTILPIYQQQTMLVDEQVAPSIGQAGYSLEPALAVSRAAIDASVAGFHTPITTQFHVGYWTFAGFSEWVTETARYARQTLGLPSLSAQDWLLFAERRGATTLTNSNWSGNVLTFDVTAGGPGQTMLIPMQYGGSILSSLRINGTPLSYPTKTINGIAYAMVSVTTGAYTASYAADQTAPTVSATVPQGGATEVVVTAPISITFSEAMDRAATQSAFSLAPAVAGTFSWGSGDTIMTFAPSAALATSTTYSVSVSGAARDRAGNPLVPASWSFTTAATRPSGPIISNVTAGTITTTSATISWTTDIPADSQVEFGFTSNYGSSTALNSTLTTAHSQTISGLSPGTVYHFRVLSQDSNGIGSQSSDGIFATTSASAASAGEWSPVQDWPLVAVHAILQPNGQVLLFDAWEYTGTPSATLWNPTNQTFTGVPNTTTELFCAGHAMLSDGRQLIIGGHAGDAVGIPDTNIFDSRTNTWIRVADMHFPRWYPTAITLADGQVLALGGQSQPGVFVEVPEVYDPVANTWTRLDGATLNIGEYPRAALMSDGRVFVSAAGTPPQSLILDVDAQLWTTQGLAASTGAIAIYRPGQIIATGGPTGYAAPVRAAASTIDINSGTPTWQATAAMAYPRYQHNLITLPDGNVLAVGGTTQFSLSATEGILQAEVWDPSTGTWTTLASMQQPRLYHSTALLLPDGRVLVAGGGRAAPAIDYPTAQLYSPPYLFAGARPVVTSAPVSAGYGRELTVWTPDAVDIESVALVRLPSVTHGTEFDQRYVPLDFTRTAETLTVQSPASAGIAPPGIYMLFVVNAAGVPSVATMIQIGGGIQSDTQAPTVVLTEPAGGATLTGPGIALSATASDNVGVASVQFLLDGQPLGAPLTASPYTLDWDSTTTANGTHTLSARAMDTVGNTAISAAITVTVANSTDDTTPPVISDLGPAKITSSYVTLTWSTNEGATSQVEWGLTSAYGNISTLDPALRTAHSRRILGLQPATTYHYRVICRDAAGNLTHSNDGVFTTAADTQAPAVQLVVPASYSFVSGQSVTVAATASDNVGVTSVQFLLDGQPLGGPLTSIPYTLDWDTTTVANGPHTLAAQARDAAGNSAMSVTIPVTVANTLTVTRIDPGVGSASGGTAVTIKGHGFAPEATVIFGGVAATSVVVAGDGTSLTAIAPAHVAGPVTVVVANPDGHAGARPNGFTYVTCPTGCILQTTAADFTAGTAGATYIDIEGDGELTLAPAAGAEFSGTSLPPSWSAAAWAAGGGAAVGDGSLTVDGALVTTDSYFAPGRAIEFVATFASDAPYQHIGLGHDLNGVPWAIFSTGGSGGALYARTNAASGADTLLPGDWLGAPHRFRIEWTTSAITYFIDGVEVASHSVGNTGNMRPVISDGAPGGAALALDWLRVMPYAPSGSYTSPILDAGGAATWGIGAWTAEVSAGTTVTVFVRTGDTPIPDTSWTAYIPLSSGSAIGGTGRFIQYHVALATSDADRTAALNDILLSYTTSATAPVVDTISPASGPIAGGTAVTITGSGFVPGATVTFGGLAATSVTVTSATSVTAMTPAHPDGPVTVVVTNPDGQTGSRPSGFSYLTPLPAVDGVSPAVGATTGGTTVTLRGTNFASATGVSFGSVAAASFTVISPTEISAITPAQTDGTVDVRVSNGGGTSPAAHGAQFTFVECPSGCFTHATLAQFSGGTFANITISTAGDGELTLAPAAGSDFSGTALPIDWAAAPWAAGGGATVGGGSLSVDGALVTTNGYFAPGHTLEFVATFAPGTPYQHLGLGADLNSAPWAIFSTAAGGSALYARTNTGGAQSDTLLPGDWLGTPHRFRIEWTTVGVTYFIDDTQVASHALGNTGDMRPVISDGAPGGATLALDWLRLGPYSTSGTYTSAVLDAGDTATWGTVAWAASAPAGTSLAISVRAGHTPTPDGSWTAFTAVANGASGGLSGRYLQYRVEMSTSNPTETAALADISIGYAITGTTGPSISSLSPSSGPAAGGTAVTITGSGFSEATGVTFGGTAASGFTIQSDTVIVATAPAHEAGAANVVVTTPTGTSTPGTASEFTFQPANPAPQVLSVAPGTGGTVGGASVTIEGTAFVGVTGVTFGGTAASFTVGSATTITAIAPAHTAGTVDVRVTTASGTSASDIAARYTYVNCPSECITQSNVAQLAAGAFNSTQVVQLADGAVQLTPAAGSDFSGVALHTGWSASPWDGGGGATIGGGTLVVDGALVTTTGYFTPGRTIEFVATFASGAPFQHIGLGHDLNGTPWAIFSTGWSGNVLYARSNGGGYYDTLIPGEWLDTPHRFRIEWTADTATYFIDGAQVASHAVGNTGDMRPVISDGPVGGAVLVLDSIHLGPFAAAGNYDSPVFDAGGVATWGAVAWTADVPSGTGLTVSLRVGTTPTPDATWSDFSPIANGATSGASGRYAQYRADFSTTDAALTPTLADLTIGYTVTGQTAPTITSMNPTSGPVIGGTVVTITGTGYTSATSVTFGGVAASFTVDSATTITATAPAHAAGTIDVIVTAPGGSTTTNATSKFSYQPPPPIVTGITPSLGPSSGGTQVTLAGSSFTGATSVAFDGTPADSFTVVSDTTITATTPPHASGTVQVTVTTAAGTSATGAGTAFTFQAPPPSVSSLSAGTGPAVGGMAVTINGTGFVGVTGVTFGGATASFAVNSATTIVATAPAHAAGTVDVRVTTAAGTSATNSAARFVYVACPDGCITQTTADHFNTGSQSDTAVSEEGDGEISLGLAVGAEFDGATLPPNLVSTPWSAGGGGTVGGGTMTVDGALVAGTTYWAPGRALEFMATFDGSTPYQHAGLGIDLNNTPWAIFSTGGSGGALYARTHTSVGQENSLLPGDWLGTPHRFRIEWTETAVTYLIDGEEVASHTLGNTGDLRPVISDGAPGGGTIVLDWLRLGPYSAAGVSTSAVFDAGGTANWQTFAWTSTTPAGTGLVMSVRVGNTPTPDETWSSFAEVVNGTAMGVSGRYLQYKVTLTTSDPAQAPILRDVTIGYALNPTGGGTIPTANAALGLSAARVAVLPSPLSVPRKDPHDISIRG